MISGAYLISVAIATGVLQADGIRWTDIGLRRPASLRRTALLAVLALVGALVAMNIVQLTAVNLPGVVIDAPDISRFDSMKGNVPVLVVGVLAAWTMIAFGEEMLFRAFLINRFGGMLNRTRAAWPVAVIASAFMFGVAHFVEGPLGMVVNGSFGLLYGSIYLASGRNLWVIIVAHGMLNTLRFVVVFRGVAG